MNPKIDDEEEELKRLATQVEKLKLENIGLHKKQYELETDRNDLRMKLNEEVAKRTALELTLEKFNKSKKRVDDEISLANLTILNLEEMMKYQESKIKMLENEVEEKRETESRLQKYAKQLVSLNEKLRETSWKISAVEPEKCGSKMIETLQATVQDLEAKLSERVKCNSTLNAQTEAHRQSIQNFQEKVRNMDNEINEKENKIKELETELKEFRQCAKNNEVNQVTQSARLTIGKVQEGIGDSSMTWRVKNKGRFKKANKLEEFEYDELRKRKRKVQTLDVERGNIPEDEYLIVDRALFKEDKNAYKCGKFISEDAFTRLQDANKHGGTVEEVWSTFPGSTPYVNVASMMAILDEKEIPETIMDAFIVIWVRAGFMKEKHHIFPAATWDMITCFEEKLNYYNALSTDIVKKIQQGQKVYFPLCCPGKTGAPYHWVLLTYGGGSGIWKMYHSCPTRSLNLDASIINCERIRNYVLRCLDGNEATKSKGTSTGVGVVKITKLPLQDNESTDCAFYLMYYMLKLSQDQPIPPSWTNAELQKFKGMIVNSIVLDKLAISL